VRNIVVAVFSREFALLMVAAVYLRPGSHHNKERFNKTWVIKSAILC
jgi:hypothetical protein